MSELASRQIDPVYFRIYRGRSYVYRIPVTGRAIEFSTDLPTPVSDQAEIEHIRMRPDIFLECDSVGNLTPLSRARYSAFKSGARDYYLAGEELTKSVITAEKVLVTPALESKKQQKPVADSAESAVNGKGPLAAALAETKVTPKESVILGEAAERIENESKKKKAEHICPKCGKKCGNAGALTKHLKMHEKVR